MKNDALKIISSALEAADPYKNVYSALKRKPYKKQITVIAVGKAACTMAQAAYDALGDKIKQGFVLTKYGHAVEMPDVFTVREAGHPVPDMNSIIHTNEIIEAAKKLNKNDKIVFLLSGGGSALFEEPIVSLETLQDMTEYMLRSGADIYEINLLRKALSNVKDGRFALMCKCHIDCFILSDVLGDRLDMVASGPCCRNTEEQLEQINVYCKYFNDDMQENLNLSRIVFSNTTSAEVKNTTLYTVGNIDSLCRGASKGAEQLGYKSVVVTSALTGEARVQTEKIIAEALDFKSKPHEPTAFIYGGETTVTVHGNGKGGRNQEAALTAAIKLKDESGILFFAFGSDGTDGPTDAAGGFADGNTFDKMMNANIDPVQYLDNNNSYNALKAVDSLIITGPTGTNVNDIFVVLVK